MEVFSLTLKYEQIKEITAKAIEQLIPLKEARTEALTHYLAAIGRFHETEAEAVSFVVCNALGLTPAQRLRIMLSSRLCDVEPLSASEQPGTSV
jgi:hypothetical protein